MYKEKWNYKKYSTLKIERKGNMWHIKLINNYLIISFNQQF